MKNFPLFYMIINKSEYIYLGSPPKRAETKDNELFHEDEIKIS